jgi:hypothetical protein
MRLTALELPGETQTLYRELMERLHALEERPALARLRGGFTRKTVSGYVYWYFKTSEGPAGQREFYIGPDTEASHAFMTDYAVDREGFQERQDGCSRLAAMLESGGAALLEAPTARIIHGLGAAGLFEAGGVLLGSLAYRLLGNHLGVRWPADGGLDGPRDLISLGMPRRDEEERDPLDALRAGHLPSCGLDAAASETWFEVRGQARRVALFVPAVTGGPCPSVLPEDPGPRFLRRFRAMARPVTLLDFVLEDPLRAAALSRGATLVQVPSPSRFAIHKLLLALRRTEPALAARDRLQAGHVLAHLLERMPWDLEEAVQALKARGGPWTGLLQKSAARISRPHPLLWEALSPGP